MSRLPLVLVFILIYGVFVASGKRHWSFTRGGPYGIDPCFFPSSANCRLSQGRSLGGIIDELFPGTFEPRPEMCWPGTPGCISSAYQWRGGMTGRARRWCKQFWNIPGCVYD